MAMAITTATPSTDSPSRFSRTSRGMASVRTRRYSSRCEHTCPPASLPRHHGNVASVRLGGVEPSRPKPVTRRRELALFAVPMVLLAIGANFGNALAPTLITEEPVAAPRARRHGCAGCSSRRRSSTRSSFYGSRSSGPSGAHALLPVRAPLRRRRAASGWRTGPVAGPCDRCAGSSGSSTGAATAVIVLFPGTLVALFAGRRPHAVLAVHRRRDGVDRGPARSSSAPSPTSSRARCSTSSTGSATTSSG